MGPILFSIYINDIVNSITGCLIHFYADDAILYCIADTVDEAIEKLQLSFNALQNSLIKLKLVLNDVKTKLLFFTRSKDIDFSSIVITTLDGTIIERVTEYKYLGIWLDERLTFKFHITNLASKSRQKIGFLYRNKDSFPPLCRKRIIESIFLSVLDYGDVIYRHASHSVLKILDPVYHSAIRFITDDAYQTHHCNLYDKVGWPSLSKRRDIHWYLFIFKSLIGKQPPYITGMLDQKNIGRYSTRSSDLLLLKRPNAGSNLRQHSFMFTAPKMWNDLQKILKIRTLPTLKQFRTLISGQCTSVCSCFK